MLNLEAHGFSGYDENLEKISKEIKDLWQFNKKTYFKDGVNKLKSYLESIIGKYSFRYEKEVSPNTDTSSATTPSAPNPKKDDDKKDNKNKNEKDAKLLDNKEAESKAKEYGYEGTHDLKSQVVKEQKLKDKTIAHYNLYYNSTTKELFLRHNTTGKFIKVY